MFANANKAWDQALEIVRKELGLAVAPAGEEAKEVTVNLNIW